MHRRLTCFFKSHNNNNNNNINGSERQLQQVVQNHHQQSQQQQQPNSKQRRQPTAKCLNSERAVDWVTVTKFRRYDEDAESDWNCGSWFEYLLTVVLSTILLVGVLILTLFWIMFYRGGFAWNENTELQFNAHPILMIAGFITLSGFSILLYRLCRCLKHIYVKLIHMFFHACAIPCIVMGFYSVYESHSLSEPPKPHFYSLHTWLGCVTMGMFVLQFVVGFFSFLIMLCCENRTYSCRATMVPIHANFGLCNFMLAIATAVTGLIEKERQMAKVEQELSPRNSEIEHYIMNALGMALVALGIIVCVAVRRSNAPATAKVYVTERI